MPTDELHKFSDGTLNHVRTTLNDIATRIQMDYLPKRRWIPQDKRRARVMISAIDRKLSDQRLMRSLEKFVGGRPYRGRPSAARKDHMIYHTLSSSLSEDYSIPIRLLTQCWIDTEKVAVAPALRSYNQRCTIKSDPYAIRRFTPTKLGKGQKAIRTPSFIANYVTRFTRWQSHKYGEMEICLVDDSQCSRSHSISSKDNGTCSSKVKVTQHITMRNAKTTAWNEFSSTMAYAIICLATNQNFNLSKYIFDAMTPITTQPSTSKPQKKQSRRKQNKATTVHQPSDSAADVPNEEFVPVHSNDPLISGEDRLKLTELMDMCTKLSERGRSDDAEMFDTDDLIGNEVFAENDMIEKDQDVIPKEVSTSAPSTTVVPPASPVITESTTTIAPSTILKAKGITFRDAGESTTRTPTSLSSSSIKDKRKAKMDKPKVPLKKKDQIALGEEMARNLEAQIQVELIEEERL
ncbi:hypothetical protein Tco_0770070 [Tanacetum coccineum]|uniref:Uncharacterized protein n=1 Tax=Tanacetum coccineum TaxID=301880 RepID=A0ABQ4ZB55_9ASTR